MHRGLYAAGVGYLALCGLAVAKSRAPAPGSGEPPTSPSPYGGAGGEWFARVKPVCNAGEVEVRQQQLPAPSGVEGAGYSAACYALAGKIDRAREVIDHLGS